MRASGSAKLTFGMVSIPVKLAKASSKDTPSTTSICSCGSKIGYDGLKCKDDDCGETYSWWTDDGISKGFNIGDEIIKLDPDEVEEAKNECPVEAGTIQKVVSVKSMLHQYNVNKSYYLIPDDDFEDQYGTLMETLNDEDLCMLTYFQLRKATRRYAIVSENGVLMAFELADKKTFTEDVEYEVDDAMKGQAKTMLDQMKDDDPELEDVEGHGLQELIGDKLDERDTEIDEDKVQAQV